MGDGTVLSCGRWTCHPSGERDVSSNVPTACHVLHPELQYPKVKEHGVITCTMTFIQKCIFSIKDRQKEPSMTKSMFSFHLCISPYLQCSKGSPGHFVGSKETFTWDTFNQLEYN